VVGPARTPAAATLHVGDNLDKDNRGATAAGLQALLIQSRDRRGAAPTVARLEDVLGWLEGAR